MRRPIAILLAMVTSLGCAAPRLQHMWPAQVKRGMRTFLLAGTCRRDILGWRYQVVDRLGTLGFATVTRVWADPAPCDVFARLEMDDPLPREPENAQVVVLGPVGDGYPRARSLSTEDMVVPVLVPAAPPWQVSTAVDLDGDGSPDLVRMLSVKREEGSPCACVSCTHAWACVLVQIREHGGWRVLEAHTKASPAPRFWERAEDE